MKVSEIKKLLKEGKQIEDLQKELQTQINIKSYLSIAQKKLIVESVIKDSLKINDTGLLICDFINKKIAFDLAILTNYTNIKLSKKSVDDYDFLQEYGIFDIIYNNINPRELDLITSILENEIKQKIKIENSFERTMLRIFNTISEKMPEAEQIQSFLKSIVKDINDLDWDKVPMLKQMFDVSQGKQ